jgi:tetratricopeptide (TPR) repeat protein
MPDADKVTGSLMISVEKGVSVSTVSRYGITMERGGFKRVKRNMIGFKILRSDWKLSLKFEVTPAWVQLSTLQKLKVRESDIECEAFLRFNIENAGIKRFRIKLPENSYGPEFEGRFISSAGPIKDNIWEIRLNRKIERSYKMKISCRLKKADETSFAILPFKVEEAAVQTGYLALFAEDSLQLALGEKQGDITSFNARNIPSSFGAKDLASAILCYRSVGTGWRAKLNIVRHKGAATLKTTIESLLLKTLAINSNMVINEVNISLSNDGAAFLPLKLPEKSVLWAAFMDARPVQVVTSGKDLLVPLKQSSDGNCKQQIRIVYSSLASSGWNKKNRVYTGPEIPLPLRNIRWELYAPEDNSYSSFDGTLNYRDELLTSLAAATLREYDEKAVSLVKTVTGNARKFLNIGNKYYKLGRSRQAMEAFQKAIDISGDTALKSDIQGQLIRNSRMNNIMNIAQRQQAFSGSQVSQVKQAPQMQKYKNLQALKDQLGSEEFQILQAISDRIFTQQQAALTIPRQFDVAIPWQGKRIAFERALEINENAPLKVEFKARSKADISSMLPGPLSFIGLAIILTLTGLLFLSPAKPKSE